MNNNEINNSGFYEIDFYDLSEDKKDLLKSIPSNLDSKLFYNALSLYNDYEYPIFEMGYIQCISKDNYRMLMPIALSTKIGHTNNFSSTFPVDMFNRKYKKYKKVGSQNYTKLLLKLDEKFEHSYVYFTDDGHVFIKENDVNIIKNMNISELCAHFAYQVERANQNCESIRKAYSYMMKPNYRNEK